jgi:hypothetical protein
MTDERRNVGRILRLGRELFGEAEERPHRHTAP